MSKKRNKKTAASGNKAKKTTNKQREERAEADRQRAAEAKKRAERVAMLKKIGIVAVCIILVLALGIPTVALSVIGAH